MPQTALPSKAQQDPGRRAVCGTGEMADRIRAFDWASTSLGPIEQWEDTLLITVNLMLGSRQPMFLFWGSELIQFYNDDYRDTLDDTQHPLALGNKGEGFWANIWHIIGPQVDAVMNGESLFLEDQFFAGRRSGEHEDTYWSYSYTPLRDPTGKVRGVFVACIDTTRAVLARGIAAQEKQRLADLFEQAPAFFAVLRGPRHIVELTNSGYQRLIGERDVLGRSLHDALPEAIAQGFGDLLDQVYTTGKPYVGRNIPFALEGVAASTRYLDFIYQPMRQVDGVITGILVFGVDVTEGYRAQQLLVQTEKLSAVGRMASTIAHEINNPLEAVTNLLYLARSSVAEGEVKEYLDLADAELRRISAISSKTLRFHRQLTNPSSVSCGQLFTNSLLIYERRIENLSVTVHKRKRAKQSLLCYEGEISQVLNNLIGNALDAVSPGGQLTVRSADATDQKSGRKGLRLTVADNGGGIAPAAAKRIFDPFFTTKGIMGTGLGLWVSQEIVHRHGGELRLRSSQHPKHHGTVFQLFLPLDGLNTR